MFGDFMETSGVRLESSKERRRGEESQRQTMAGPYRPSPVARRDLLHLKKN